MKKLWPLIAAVLIQALIRAALLTQHPQLSYTGFETLTHVTHIIAEGTPLIQRDVWGGVEYLVLPLSYYIIAFVGVVTGPYAATLIVPNLFAIGISVLTYYIAQQLTRDKVAIAVTTLASAFSPLLYSHTLFNADPHTFGIFFLLLGFYYFLRLIKTPRVQIGFIVSILVLTLSDPLILLLGVSLALSLLFSTVQKTPVSRSIMEATLLTVLFSLWAILLVYKRPIQNYGILLLQGNYTLSTTDPRALIALLGIIPLVGAAYAAQHYLVKEENTAVHATIALLATCLAATILGVISTTTGVLLSGIILTLLIAPAITELRSVQSRSRLPGLYRFMGVVLAIAFLSTSGATAVIQATQATQIGPTQGELELILQLQKRHITGHVLWESEYGPILEYNGLSPLITTNHYMSDNSEEILSSIMEAKQSTRQLTLLKTLNKLSVEILISAPNETLAISQRCFEQIPAENWNVYHIRCEVQ